MEVIKKGSEQVSEMGLKGCCWPMGTMGFRVR